jgi:hypothetical protein
MSYTQHTGQAERPRSEPEIIPPGYDRTPWPRDPDSSANRRDESDAFIVTDVFGRTHRVRARRISPLAAIAIGFGIAFVIALLLLVAIGAVLIWLPIAAALVLGLLAFAKLRGSWRRWRNAR